VVDMIAPRYFLSVAGIIRREGSHAVADELVKRARSILADDHFARLRADYSA
jgi:hypothetical protein